MSDKNKRLIKWGEVADSLLKNSSDLKKGSNPIPHLNDAGDVSPTSHQPLKSFAELGRAIGVDTKPTVEKFEQNKSDLPSASEEGLATEAAGGNETSLTGQEEIKINQINPEEARNLRLELMTLSLQNPATVEDRARAEEIKRILMGRPRPTTVSPSGMTTPSSDKLRPSDNVAEPESGTAQAAEPEVVNLETETGGAVSEGIVPATNGTTGTAFSVVNSANRMAGVNKGETAPRPRVLSAAERVDSTGTGEMAELISLKNRIEKWLQELQFRDKPRKSDESDERPSFNSVEARKSLALKRLLSLQQMILHISNVKPEELAVYQTELAEVEYVLQKEGYWLYSEAVQNQPPTMTSSWLTAAAKEEETVAKPDPTEQPLDPTPIPEEPPAVAPREEGEINSVLGEKEEIASVEAVETGRGENKVPLGSDSIPPIDTPETPTTTEEPPLSLYGLTIPSRGPDRVFAARAFREALLLIRRRVGPNLNADQAAALEQVLSIVERVPNSGLTETQVDELQTLTKVINQPDSPYKFKTPAEIVAAEAAKHNPPALAEAYSEKRGFRQHLRRLGYVAALAAAAAGGITIGKKLLENNDDTRAPNLTTTLSDTPVLSTNIDFGPKITPLQAPAFPHTTPDLSAVSDNPGEVSISPEFVLPRLLYRFEGQRGTDGEVIDTVSEAIYDEWKKQPALVERKLTRSQFLPAMYRLINDLDKNPVLMHNLTKEMRIKSGDIDKVERVFENTYNGEVDLAPFFRLLNQSYL